MHSYEETVREFQRQISAVNLISFSCHRGPSSEEILYKTSWSVVFVAIVHSRLRNTLERPMLSTEA